MNMYVKDYRKPFVSDFGWNTCVHHQRDRGRDVSSKVTAETINLSLFYVHNEIGLDLFCLLKYLQT